MYRCNKDMEVCEGVPLYGKCSTSADCVFGLFCSYSHCVKTLNIVLQYIYI